MDRRVVITADDYGMCQPVNQAIEECLAAGSVKATCVMTNMPAFDPTTTLRNKFPQISLGIHWTMTEGHPVLSPSRVPSLVSSDGSFYTPSEFRQRWLLRRIVRNELKAELRAQYQRFFESAGQPDFWNSHQNFHVFPGVYEVCVTLGQELGIPSMRSHRRFLVPYREPSFRYNLRHPLYCWKGYVISRWVTRAKDQGMVMPDGIVYAPGYESDLDSLEKVLERVPWNSVEKAVEIIIHPATTSKEKMFHTNAERRVREYKTYTSSCLSDRLEEAGIQLVGFEALQSQPNPKSDISKRASNES